MAKAEVEAKFAVPDRPVFERLLEMRTLAGFAAGERTVQRVTDHYLDTPGRAILAAGYACRVRADETGQVLTLKALGRSSDAIMRRSEHQVRLRPTSRFWDMTCWPAGPAKALLERLLLREAQVADEQLEIVLILQQTRRVCRLLDEGRPVVQLSLDEVRYAPGEPVFVLEAELSPTGTEEDLGRITQALTEEWRLASAPLSKLEHGLGAVEAWDGLARNRPSADERLALARLTGSGRAEQGRAAHMVLLWDAGLRPQTIATIVRLSQPRVLYWLHTFSKERIAAFQALTAGRMTGVTPPTPRRRSKQPDILPDDPMSEAGRKTFLLHFERMLAHEPGTRLGEDIEELHDMRVATRRMRAAVPVFGPYFQAKALKPHLKGLKRTGRALGPVRDLDVFEEKAQRYLSSQPADQAGILEGLLAVWHGERDAARKRMLAYLDTQAYSGFVARFGRFLSTERAGARDLPAGKPVPYQVRHVAPRLIYARYEEVLAYEPMLDAPAIELLHALRIDFKRLRYTLEFFLPLLGPKARSVIEEVKGMQDHLGDLNDADVATQMLDDLLQEPSELSEHQRRGIGAYRQYRHEEKQQLLRSFPAAWVQFNQPRTRRNLALAVAAL